MDSKDLFNILCDLCVLSGETLFVIGKMIKSEINIRVLYAHTDNMDIGNNGSYIEYMEEF